MKFIVHEDDREYEFLLTPGLYIVGRDPTCDLTLDSKRVSRRHMSCTVTENEVQIRDLGSRNGLRINGEKTKEEKLTKNAKITVGDVTLDFKTSAPAAAAGGVAQAPEQEEVVSARATVEDSEQTPPEGSLVRREDVETGAALQKQEEPEETESLLRTRKGRLILGSLAGGVVLLLLVAVLFGGGEPSNGGGTRDIPEFDQAFTQTLNALDAGNPEKATKLARLARKIRPESKAAEELVDLVRVWKDWEDSFFENGNYRQLKGKLITLYQYYDSSRLRRFKQKYDKIISQEMANSDVASNARELYEQERYEEAWEKLEQIPADSAVRERDAKLYEQVKNSLRSQLEQRMQTAANRQNWAEASKTARKLQNYVEEDREKIDEKLREFSRNESHLSEIENARQAIRNEEFDQAIETLKQLPEDSIYTSEARRLRQRAKARGKLRQARQLYNQGNVDESVDLLERSSVDGAENLKQHVIEVAELYKKARAVQEEQKFDEAQELWRQLENLEQDPDNIFHQKAQEALRDLPKKRKEVAISLVEKAKKQMQNDQYENCRELAEQAVQLDPDDTIGTDYLEALKKQGRNDYRVALNSVKDNPERALRLLKRALEFLSTDDPYYMRARDKKQELEERLGEN